MANWTNLKAAIAETITTNGNQEITGAVLQSTLNAIVNTISANAAFAGVATPSTNPGVPDGPVFYLAGISGAYSNFGITLHDEIAVITNTSNGSWTKSTVLGDITADSELDATFNSGYIHTEDRTVGQVLSLTAYESDILSYAIVDVSEYDYARITAQGTRLYYTYVFLDANNTIISYDVSGSLADENVMIPEGAVTLVVNNNNSRVESPSVKIVSTISSRLDNIAQQIAAVEDEVETLNDALNDAVNVKTEAEFAYGYIYTKKSDGTAIAVGDTLTITVSTSDTIKYAILDVAGYDNVMFSGKGSANLYTYLLLDENNVVLDFNVEGKFVDETIDLTSLETHPTKIIVQANLAHLSDPKLVAYSSISSSVEELHKEVETLNDALNDAVNVKTEAEFAYGYIYTQNVAVGDTLKITVSTSDTIKYAILDVAGCDSVMFSGRGSALLYTYLLLDENNVVLGFNVNQAFVNHTISLTSLKTHPTKIIVHAVLSVLSDPKLVAYSSISSSVEELQKEIVGLNDALNDVVNVKTEAEFAYGYIYTENIAVGDTLKIMVADSDTVKCAILDVAGYDNVMFSGKGSVLAYTYLLLDENNVVLGFNASDKLVDYTIDLTSLETHPTKIIVQAALSQLSDPKLVAYSTISSRVEAINDTLVEIEDRISTSGSVIQGKKIVVFGDSLMEGTDEQEGKTVSQYIEELSGATVYNAGIGGTAYRRRWRSAFNDYTVEIFDETTKESENYDDVKDYAYSFLDLSVLVPAWASGDLTNCLKAAQWLAEYASDDNTPQIKRLQSIPITEVDIVIMSAGANDFPYSNVAMVGKTTDINTADRSTNTVLGGLNLCIKSLLGAGSRLSLFVFSPICRYFGTRGEGDMAEWFDESLWSDNYTPVFGASSAGVNYRDGVDMIIETARAAGVPVCDAYRGLGWNRYNYWNYLSSTNLTDGVHAKRGYDKMAVLYYNFITSGTTAAGKGEGGDITVDGALSETSTNPVQNKVIDTALKGKQDALGDATILTINNTPLALGDSITIEGGSGGSVTVDSELSETSENPVQNKVVTAEIAAAIEEGKNLVLQKIFTAVAGVVYNAQTGLYSLNGITDLSEDDMFAIYNEREGIFRLNIRRYFQANTKIRTIIPCRSSLVSQILEKYPLDGYINFYGCTNLEVLQWHVGQNINGTNTLTLLPAANMLDTFTLCTKLHTIYPINVSKLTSISDTVFGRCTALKELRLYGLKTSVKLPDSGNLSKDSILYIINNSNATSAITITLHADVYAKCSEGGEWYDDVEAAFVNKYGDGTRYITLQSA